MRVRMHLRGSGGRVGTAVASDSTRTAAVAAVRAHSSTYVAVVTGQARQQW